MLNDGTGPANGSYDLRLTVYDALTGGAQKGNAVTNTATAVNNGWFAVTLDPGAGVFDGSARWLEIAVRTNGGGSYTTLTPRQAITPTPYAIHAGQVNAAGVVGSLPASALLAVIRAACNSLIGAINSTVAFKGMVRV